MPSTEDDDSELRGVRHRFHIAAALSIPLVLIAMVPHFLNLHFTPATASDSARPRARTVTTGRRWAGLDYYRRGWLGVRNRSPNMYTLIGLGVLVAFPTHRAQR